jgi:hypothetical protein
VRTFKHPATSRPSSFSFLSGGQRAEIWRAEVSAIAQDDEKESGGRDKNDWERWGIFRGRLGEPFERATSLSSRATSLLFSLFSASSRARARLVFYELDQAEPQAGSARLDSTLT